MGILCASGGSLGSRTSVKVRDLARDWLTGSGGIIHCGWLELGLAVGRVSEHFEFSSVSPSCENLIAARMTCPI